MIRLKADPTVQS